MSKILVVEDDAPTREFVAQLLRYRTHEVLEAADGREGLELARAEHPDLVITDLLMPTMDGFEFARRLRTDAEIATTPVIFFTASYHGAEARKLAETCGAASFLTKPCEPEALLSAVSGVLTATQVTPPVPSLEEFDREHLRLVSNKLLHTLNNLELLTNRFDAAVDIAIALATERDPDQLFVELSARARGLIGCRYAFVAVLDETGTRYRLQLVAGLEPDVAAGFAPRCPPEGVFGRVLRERVALRLAGSAAEGQRTALMADLPLLESLLVVPIMSSAAVYGWLCLANRLGRDEFTGSDEQLARSLGAAAATIYRSLPRYGAAERYALAWRATDRSGDPVTIVIAGDRRIVREGIRALLEREPEFRVLGEASDGIEAVRIVRRLKPDVLISAISTPGFDGVDVAREVSTESRETKIVMLSAFGNERSIRDAIRSGVVGYVLESAAATELVEAIRCAAGGRRYLSPPLSQLAIDRYAERADETPIDPYEALTTRERAVLKLAAQGRSNKEIGARLFISPRTVEVHRAKLKRKLGLRTHSDLVEFVVRRGLTRTSE